MRFMSLVCVILLITSSIFGCAGKRHRALSVLEESFELERHGFTQLCSQCIYEFLNTRDVPCDALLPMTIKFEFIRIQNCVSVDKNLEVLAKVQPTLRRGAACPDFHSAVEVFDPVKVGSKHPKEVWREKLLSTRDAICG